MNIDSLICAFDECLKAFEVTVKCAGADPDCHASYDKWKHISMASKNIPRETPRERFRREYRDARMVAQVAPNMKTNNPTYHLYSWEMSIKNQCSRAAAYAINGFDSMDGGLSLSGRLSIYKSKKHWGQLWTN